VHYRQESLLRALRNLPSPGERQQAFLLSARKPPERKVNIFYISENAYGFIKKCDMHKHLF
jgi:hypothetical protein